MRPFGLLAAGSVVRLNPLHALVHSSPSENQGSPQLSGAGIPAGRQSIDREFAGTRRLRQGGHRPSDRASSPPGDPASNTEGVESGHRASGGQSGNERMV